MIFLAILEINVSDLETGNFMEGLVSYRINLVCGYGRKNQCRSVPASTLYLRKNAYGVPIGIMKQYSISFNLMAASLQPVRASKVGHSENMLPSEGHAPI